MSRTKIKITIKQANALLSACLSQSIYFTPQDQHEQLLLEHVRELLLLLEKHSNEERKNITLKLSPASALAFLQFWCLVPMEAGSLPQVTIANILYCIDQQSKQPKMITHEQPA